MVILCTGGNINFNCYKIKVNDRPAQFAVSSSAKDLQNTGENYILQVLKNRKCIGDLECRN